MLKRLTPLLVSMLATWIGSTCAAETAAGGTTLLKSFRIDAFEKVIVPRADDIRLGEPIELTADGTKVLRVPLGYRYVARMDRDTNATVGGLQQSIFRGEIFTRRKASGGRISELPQGAVILCRQPVQHDLGKALAAAATLGVTQIAARYSTDIQLCAIDANQDGHVEKLFLGGAKQQEDLEFTDIDPIPYEHRENEILDGINLVIYITDPMLWVPSIAVGVELGKQRNIFDQMSLEENGKMKSQWVSKTIGRNTIGKDVVLGSAIFTIEDYDKEKKNLRISFKKAFETQKIDWYIAPQTIYIYY